MTVALAAVLAVHDLVPVSETYGELLRSRSHWLFELTLEMVTAPLALGLGWLWRNGLLRHLHRDLYALEHGSSRPCVEPSEPRRAPGGPGPTGGAARAPRGAALARRPGRHRRGVHTSNR